MKLILGQKTCLCSQNNFYMCNICIPTFSLELMLHITFFLTGLQKLITPHYRIKYYLCVKCKIHNKIALNSKPV